MQTLKYSTESKAQKDHVCNFCGGKIFKNEVYLKSTHVGDGQVYDWKAHKYCSMLATKLNMYEDADDGVTQDMFIDAVSYKHDDLLIEMFPKEDVQKYSDVIQQLRHVNWRNKLFFVIKHFNKIEKQNSGSA